MAHTKMLFRGSAREKVLQGATQLADAIRVNLGPKSKSLLIQKKCGAPQVCNDGVTIAKQVNLEDPEENLGVQMLRQAAERTGEAVGDGTSTSTVLADDYGVPTERSHFIIGSPISAIADFARLNQTAVLVMGIVQRKGLDKLIGSTTEHLLYQVPRSILAVKAEPSATGARRPSAFPRHGLGPALQSTSSWDSCSSATTNKKRLLRDAARGLADVKHSADFDVDVFFRFDGLGLLRHADGQHTLSEAGLDFFGIDALG
jgi:nucleotide-binding universal stress UspA family protein